MKMSRVKSQIHYIHYPFFIYDRKSYNFVIVRVQLFTLATYFRNCSGKFCERQWKHITKTVQLFNILTSK